MCDVDNEDIAAFSRIVIPVSSDEITILAQKADGWEPVWGRVYGLLGLALDERTTRLGIQWPADGIREEFIASQLEKFETRFDEGMLFTGTAGGCRDLAKSLLSMRYLHNKSLSFISRRRVKCPVSFGSPLSSDGGSEAISMGELFDESTRRIVYQDNQMYVDDYAEKRDNLDDSLINLLIAVETPTNPSAVEEHAGVQLHPRCDWSPMKMKMLHRAVVALFPHSPSDEFDEAGEADARLARMHRRRRQELEVDFTKQRATVAELSLGAKKEFRRLVNRLNKMTFEYFFRPLDAEALMELFPIQCDHAAKLRQRYRDNIETLLRGNAVLNGALAGEDEKCL